MKFNQLWKKLNSKPLVILYNQDEQLTVLNYSDRLMSHVKDVFADNIKKEDIRYSDL